MDSTLRIIDANANRAREALRVLEDYARFAINSRPIQEALKTLRHDLTRALIDVLPESILHRDILGDVGKETKTPQELIRADLAEVITANGKRLGEALRVLEEILKIEKPAAAAILEACRYRFYDVELRLARSLAFLSSAARLKDARVYVLITESACRMPWKEVALLALDGGADLLQLREKNLDGREFLKRAAWLAEACRGRAISIVNDRVDVAALSGVDGVHLGQTDLPVPDARKILGAHKIIGLSTHNFEMARLAAELGADYVGIGPVFLSPTKPRDFTVPTDVVAKVAAALLPAFAIAGITEANLDELIVTGVRRVAVTSCVTKSADPAAVVGRIKNRLAGQ